MARRKKMVVRRELLSPASPLEEETRGSVAVTVAWMLSLLASGLALFLASAAFLATQTLRLSPDAEKQLGGLCAMMVITAAITGVVCLIFTVAVYRVRRDRPPVAITVAAVIVSVVPIALLFFLI